MTTRRGNGNKNTKRRAHAKARYERILKDKQKQIGPDTENECIIISRTRNPEDSTLDGTTMVEIPKDYLVLYKNKVAIRDRSTNEIVLIVSFTRFKDIESSEEYMDLEKLTMSLAKLKKGGSGYIKNNKAHIGGKMFALGWRGGMDSGYTMGHYVMGRDIQKSETTIKEWENDQVELVKWIADFYESRFMKLTPCFHAKMVAEALQVGVPLLAQTEFTNLKQNFQGFSSNLTYTVDDFHNTFHRDRDHSSYVYGIWAPTFSSNGKLAKITDGFFCNGGHFIIPSYKIYVDFGQCDGIVEIIWRANKDFHATSQSSTSKGFTRVGTSTQIAQDLVDRVELLLQRKKDGEDVNPQIRGVKKIVLEKKRKLNNET